MSELRNTSAAFFHCPGNVCCQIPANVTKSTIPTLTEGEKGDQKKLEGF